MFVSRRVMFIWDVFKQVYDFLFFSLKRTKLCLSFDWDLSKDHKVSLKQG